MDVLLAQATNQTTIQVQSGNLFQGIDFRNPSWDVFVLLFFLVGALLYGLSLGRDRIIVILVSIYMSLTVVKALPDVVLKFTFGQEFAIQVTAFVAVFLGLFFLVSRSALVRTLGVNASDGKWYQTIIFSVLHVGLLISVTMSFLPAEVIHKFAPVTQMVFTNEWAKFAWIAAPIIAMIVFGSKKTEVDNAHH